MRAIGDDATLRGLDRPVAVFDAGIGSYAAVALIQRLLPRQDIVYFADRASFPYGDKSRSELLGILHRTLRFLDGFSPASVLVASNAPSGTGRVLGLVTEDDRCRIEDFRGMLSRLGVSLPLHTVLA